MARLEGVSSPASMLAPHDPLDLFLGELGEQELDVRQPRRLAVSVVGVGVLGLLSQRLRLGVEGLGTLGESRLGSGHVCFLVG